MRSEDFEYINTKRNAKFKMEINLASTSRCSLTLFLYCCTSCARSSTMVTVATKNYEEPSSTIFPFLHQQPHSLHRVFSVGSKEGEKGKGSYIGFGKVYGFVHFCYMRIGSLGGKMRDEGGIPWIWEIQCPTILRRLPVTTSQTSRSDLYDYSTNTNNY